MLEFIWSMEMLQGYADLSNKDCVKCYANYTYHSLKYYV